MKVQKKKKKTQERLTIEELIAGKAWGYLVTDMPLSVQRNTITFLEAFEKNNLKRMEQSLKQIQEGDRRPLKLLLAITCFIKQNYEKTIRLMEELISEEQNHEPVAERECIPLIPELNMRNIMDVPSVLRLEVYKSIVASAYDAMGDSQKAVEICDAFFPPIRKCHNVYEEYLLNLLLRERYEDGRRVAREFLDCMTKGKYGEDYFRQFFDQEFEFPDLHIEEIQEQIREGNNLRIALDCIVFYQGLLECDIYIGDRDAFERDFMEAANYVRNLNEGIKYHKYSMHLIGQMIIEASQNVYLDKRWSVPFRRILDYVDASEYYNEIHDPEKFYDDLIPSGYRVLEDVEYSKDKEMDRFIGGMIDDALGMLNAYGAVDVDERDQFRAWLRGEGALWNIARYCTEGDAQREIVQQSFDRMKELYPYKWKFMEREVQGIMDRSQEYMGEIQAAMIRSSKKNVTEKEMRNALEEAYQKTICS